MNRPCESPNQPRVLSLCSGIGGMDIGHQDKLVAVSETDPDASAVLSARLPHIPNLGDWTALESLDEFDPTDLTAGLPCQPVSAAGKGEGEDDERWLYDELAGLLNRSRAKPTLWLENVPGICSERHAPALRRFLGRIANMGYSARWGVVAACVVGAVHRRRRWWCVAWHSWNGREPKALYRGEAGTGDALLDGAPRRSEPWILPTPIAVDYKGGHPNHEDRAHRHLREIVMVLLPTPTAADGTGASRGDADKFSGNAQMRDIPRMLLPTPISADFNPPHLDADERPYWNLRDMPALLDKRPDGAGEVATPHLELSGAMGAIRVYLHEDHQDEQIQLIPALAAAGVGERELALLANSCANWSARVGWWTPTISHKAPGLAAQWSEWMMGHPCGWTTEVLPRRRALRLIGASVVPQQAAAAFTILSSGRLALPPLQKPLL